MKMKYLIFVTAIFALMNVGCSDKKEEPQNQQQIDVPVASDSVKKMPQAKNPKIPLDSSQILTYKDIDQSDSIMVGIRAFETVEKEFVKRWNYAGEKRWLLRVVDEICRKKRSCASRMDSVAYKADVFFVLDSLIRNKQLDSLVEMHKDRDYELQNRDCSWANAPKGLCPENPNSQESKKRMKTIMDSIIKKHNGQINTLMDSLKEKYKGR